MTPPRSLGHIAGIVGLATFLSKAAGLLRSVCIAAVFGVGSAADAYSYAYIIPGFFLVLMGGLNGPLHTALVSTLAKRQHLKDQRLGQTVAVIMTAVLLPATIGAIIFAEPLLHWVAPGLSGEVRAIAIPQLQIMAPLILLSGGLGIGLGLLTAADVYWIPSISPALSSLAVMGSLAVFVWQSDSHSLGSESWMQFGGVVLAVGTVIGAVGQWFLQQWALWKAQRQFSPSQESSARNRGWCWTSEGLGEVFQIMLPATFSSGLMSINVYVDLFFASYIPRAAAALSYAELLAQAPRGILSSMLLVPLLPAFSQLSAPEQNTQLKAKIRQGLVLTALIALPLSALLIALATPIVRLIYERKAFDSSAAQWVASLLRIYGIGMFPSLVRDVLVRVFYGLGDATTPFRISLFNVGLNVALDFYFVQWFSASGLLLSSLGINMMAIALLLAVLHHRLAGLPWRTWSLPILQILGISIVTGVISWGSWFVSHQVFPDKNEFLDLGQVCLSGGIGVTVFGLLAWQTHLPEVRLLGAKLIRK